MCGARVSLTRSQILAFRRRVAALDERLRPGTSSLRQAAWAGLQDSMPRAALLSIHARLHGAQPSAWEDPSLVQLWGPRYSTYVVAAADAAVFTVGRLPDDERARQKAEDVADRLEALLDGRRMTDRDAGAALGKHPNWLRYGAPTGRVLIRWEGARAPTVWTVPRPEIDPSEARLELARRYLHVFGPATPESFAEWTGIGRGAGVSAFGALGRALTPVRTPLGDAWILSADEPAVRADPRRAAPARLLPSGDAYYLLQGRDRELLVTDPDRRPELWTPRVWPGAAIVGGEVVGTWRRAGETVAITAWKPLTNAAHEALESEARSLPLPGLRGPIVVRWEA